MQDFLLYFPPQSIYNDDVCRDKFQMEYRSYEFQKTLR